MQLDHAAKAAGIAWLERIVRHAVAPLTTLAVGWGWLPASAETKVVEAVAVVGSFFLALWWSTKHERRIRSTAEQHPSTGGDSAGAGPDRVEGERDVAASQGPEAGA